MFQEQLAIELGLTIGSDVFAVPGGSVKRFEVEAHTYGFVASVTFSVSSELVADEIYPRFVTDDLIRVVLSVGACDFDSSGAKVPPLKVTGYVSEKSLVETVGMGIAGEPVLVRRYALTFIDAAQLFWKQHFPVELHVDASMSKLLDMHKAEGISLSYNGGPFGQKHKMLFLAASDRSSFYDFVCWYLNANSCVMEFDAETSSYTLSKTKGKKGSIELEQEDLEQLDVVLPQVLRHELHVLNSFSEGKKNQTVTVPTSVTGVRQDVLYTTPIAKSFEERVATESERLKPRKDGLRLELKRFPLVELRIGTLVKLGDQFSRNLHAAKAAFRVHHLTLKGTAAGDSAPWNAGLEDEVGTHDVHYHADLENKADPTLRLPAFTPPSYPSHVEAKIVSFGGDDKDRTWFSIEDKDNSTTAYQVDIPLFNKKVEAPFSASLMSGHFFFPAYKHARVLVALRFNSAEIVRHLDWAENARLPKDTQGNQIVFGYQKTNGTSIQHVYKDAKPVLQLNRTFGNDVQTLEISEGLMRWKVEEVTTAQKLEPKYDVTVQVEGAKGQVATKVGGSVAVLGASFQKSSGSVVTAITGATEEVETSVANMEAKLTSSIEMIKAEILALSETLMASFDAVTQAIATAKDAIVKETLT